MPRRYQILANQEVYHIFNRSIGKEQIFVHKRDLNRVLELVDYYRYPQKLRYSQFKLLSKDAKHDYLTRIQKQQPLIEIYCFAFMPNHYHLLLKQIKEKGIVRFIANLQNSFAKYFNLIKRRDGGVFQSPFKAKRVETDEELLHISRYIHLNPVTSFLVSYDQLFSYPNTSYPTYRGDKRYHEIVDTIEILSQFKKNRNYLSFVADQADYQKTLGVIKHLIID